METKQKRLFFGILAGVAIGAIMVIVTHETWWIIIGIAVGAAIGAALVKEAD